MVRAVGGGGLLVLPGEPLVLLVVRAVVLEVHELVGALEEVDDLALLDGDHVAGAAAGGDLLGELGVVRPEVALGGLDDLDAGVVLLELLVELLVAEVAEDVDPQGHVLAGALGVVAAAGCEGGCRQGSGSRAGR